MKLWKLTLTGVLSLGVLTGCAPNINADSYETSNTQQVTAVKHGAIISTSQVSVSGSSTPGGNWAGTLAGGAAGAVAGSSFGGGSGSALLGIGGAVLGGMAGNAAEQAITSQTATQYIVQLSNGSTISVTQGGTVLPTGTKVLLLEGNPARLIVDTSTSSGS